jgi:hypothetical protein
MKMMRTCHLSNIFYEIQRLLKIPRVVSTNDAGYCRSYKTLIHPLMLLVPVDIRELVPHTQQ